MVKIRKATKSDLKEIMRFKNLIKEEETKFNDSLLDFKKVKKHYEEYTVNDLTNEHRRIFAAEENGKIIGVIMGKIYRSLKIAGYKRRGYVSNLFILNKHRGKGIAKKLINKLFKWFKDKGVKEMTLEIYHGNIGARRLYKDLGFKEYSVKMFRKLQ